MICKTLWSILVSLAAVINNPKSQGFLATKFYFLFTLQFVCRSLSIWLLLHILFSHPGWKRGPKFGHTTLMAEGIKQRDWWKPAPTLKDSAQMWSVSHPLICHWPKKATCRNPTSMGQECVLLALIRGRRNNCIQRHHL